MISEPMPGENEPVIKLSQRQAQVVVLTAKSLSKEQICLVLGITKKTLESHLEAISRKIGTNTRQELTMLAVAKGWIDNPYLDMIGSIICDVPPDI